MPHDPTPRGQTERVTRDLAGALKRDRAAPTKETRRTVHAAAANARRALAGNRRYTPPARARGSR